MNNETMIAVPLEEFIKGVGAIAILDAMERFVIDSKYSISRGEIASILGFELPHWESDE